MQSVLCVLCLLCVAAPTVAQDKEDEYFELMKVFVETFEQIERNYVKDIDRRELMEAAIQGMLKKLDQYSAYISPEDKERFELDVSQEFGGIGIQVHIDDTSKRLTVMTPLPGTPAYESGVRAGDVIMEIESKSTEGFSITDAVKLLKGKPGDAVTIGVRHEGSVEIEQIEIVRAVIRVATVLGDTYKENSEWNFILDDENKIGYIRLTHFSRRSAQELKNALGTLKSQGVKGLILDLRYNPGGLLSQATRIADMFVESGKIVSTKGRNTRERVWTAKERGTFSSFPMAVLVNRYSASASEIVSACLQDHKRAAIVGERTWGKGSVQNVIELEGGSSALKLTTASYHRPSGKNIHRFPGAKKSDEWGVMPDEKFRVRFSGQEMGQYLKYRRQRDVLSKQGPPKSDFEDRQLAKGVEFIREKLGLDKPGEKKTEPAKPKEKQEKNTTKNDAKKKPDNSAAKGPRRIRLPVGIAA